MDQWINGSMSQSLPPGLTFRLKPLSFAVLSLEGSMYAILRAGGKQLKVAPGDIVRIEKPSAAVSKGEELVLSDVLFVGGEDGKEPRAGSGVSVKATVIGTLRTR